MAVMKRGTQDLSHSLQLEDLELNPVKFEQSPCWNEELAGSMFRRGQFWSWWRYKPSYRSTIYMRQLLLLPAQSYSRLHGGRHLLLHQWYQVFEFLYLLDLDSIEVNIAPWWSLLGSYSLSSHGQTSEIGGKKLYSLKSSDCNLDCRGMSFHHTPTLEIVKSFGWILAV